ncbi:MAG: pyridoxamine 5'-phosphate oxidase family protein [Candidatus Methanomethylophilaceae archaeon]|nr:pyridoxamine 5'-phosphate oxidase family protein [Candidatus Methanomethylophilaceae archaeon]
MAKLTPEIEAEMKKQGVFALATATKDGVPNVVPVGMLFVGEDCKVWLIDNFLKKTLKNITENPQVSFYVWNPEAKESYQVKERAAVISSGADYEKAVAFAHSKKETLPAKNLVKIDVTEVYYTTPGPHAGDPVE